MSETLHVRTRHPGHSENSVPFPHAPSISRQSLSLSPADIESLGYSYSQAYDSLSHEPDATYQTRLSRTPAGSIRSVRGRLGAKQLSPVAEENEERRRSRGSHTSSPMTHRSSVAAPPLDLEPNVEPNVVGIFPEDVTEVIMSLLPQVEARIPTSVGHRPRRFKILRAFGFVMRTAKAAGNAISGALRSHRAFA
jgi:hypothetical protein